MLKVKTPRSGGEWERVHPQLSMRLWASLEGSDWKRRSGNSGKRQVFHSYVFHSHS